MCNNAERGYMELKKQDKNEWVKYNACKFCIGSNMHTCTRYSCKEAMEKAEEYFDKVESKIIRNC